MPSHQRLGPDGRHCLHDRWKPPIQLEEEQAIAVRELDPTAHVTLKHNQLTSERGILSLKPADRPERRNQQPQKEEEQRDHRGRRYVIPSPDQTDEVFGTHRADPAHRLALGIDALRISAPIRDQAPTERVERYLTGIAANDQQVLARRGVPPRWIVMYAAVAHVHAIYNGIAKWSATPHMHQHLS